MTSYLNTTILATSLTITSTITTSISPNTTSFIATCNAKFTAQNIAFMMCMLTMLLVSLLGNSLVVLLFFSSRKFRSTIVSKFLVSLACSDVLMALAFVAAHLSDKLTPTFCLGRGVCVTIFLTDIIANVASVLVLLLVAFDRFVAISKPFLYPEVMTHKRATILVCCVWAFALLWSILSLFRWEPIGDGESFLAITRQKYSCAIDNKNFYLASFLGVYLVPLCLMTFMYLVILRVAFYHIRAIETQQVVLQPRIEDTNRERQSTDSRTTTYGRRRRELKATKSVAIVYCAFFLCWFPNLVLNVYGNLNKGEFTKFRDENPKTYNFIFYTFFYFLPLLNTMINPIIYSFSNKHFRAAARSLYARKFAQILRSHNGSRRNTEQTSLEVVSSSPERKSVASSISDARSPDQLVKKFNDNKGFVF